MSLASGAIGPGGLPSPSATYPAGLQGVPSLPATNKVSLAGGGTFVLPRGTFQISTGGVMQVQWLNPVTTIWENYSSARMQPDRVISDGGNFRLANLTGCPVAAIVTNGGTIGYNQATTTITASGSGGSQWIPIVGGTLGTAVSIVASGSGYGLPPIVTCPAPPAPGVPATWVAILTAGSVSSIACLDQGAGYTGNQPLIFTPDPSDPNVLAGTPPVNGSALATIVTANGTATNGKLIAVLCANPGAPITTVPTLTVTGASTGAAVTAVPLWTATGLTVTNGSTISASNLVISSGGVPTVTAAFLNPGVEPTGYTPRMAQMLAAVGSGTLVLGSTVSAIYDGGLFTGTPTPILLASAGVTGTVGIAFTLGSANATATIQPVA